jgi:outer membrane lipoprotein LolB
MVRDYLHLLNMTRLSLRHLSVACAYLIVSFMAVSCTSIPQQPVDEEPLKQVSDVPDGWQEQQSQRRQIENWEIRGRIGVQTKTNGGSMDIIWKQAQQSYSIRLIAPLGAGSYHVQGEQGFAEVRHPDGRKEIIDNVDKVFASTLNVDLPTSAIKDWIRGLPAASLTQEKISWNVHGLPDKLKQSGWNVHLTKYTGKDLLLPHAIYLSRDDDTDLDIRLVLRQWLVD